MRNFLRKRFRSGLEKFADKVNRNEEIKIPVAKAQGKADADDVLDFFMDSLAVFAGNGEDCRHRDDVEFLKCFLVLAARMDISVRSSQDACALNDMVKDYLDDIRLWSNRGFTRRELRGQKQGTSEKVNRNAPCPCGSGLKYKKCCGRG